MIQDGGCRAEVTRRSEKDALFLLSPPIGRRLAADIEEINIHTPTDRSLRNQNSGKN